MASYLSYFTSNSSSAPPQQQYQQAQPATSTWTSTVSSRLTSLRKALTRDSEDDDPDYEDCSHVSNVLRAYYAQKSQSLPEWLPPDPKKPVSQPPPQQYGQYGAAYGNQYGGPAHARGGSGGRGGLSDLWDASPAQSAPTMQPQSLRAPRSNQPSQTAYETRSRPSGLDPYTSPPMSGARPLPSQRAGSYQNTPAAGTGSKADRLRARLQGGGSGRNSPASNQFGAQSQSDADSYGSQPYGSKENGSYPSSTQDRSDGGYGGNRDPNGGFDSHGFGNGPYRQRPGGPR